MTGTGGAPPVSIPERAAQNERIVVLAGLALVTAAGLYASLRTGGALMPMSAGSIAYAVLLFVMWWTMMLAMMLPSAAPAILMYAAMNRKFAENGAARVPSALFAGGYGAVWTGFSAAAMVLQLLIQPAIPLNGMMAVTGATAGGLLLLAAGLYQMTSLKHACLRKCQTPLMFFARNWRTGKTGAFRMGLSHGTYCLGCCWVLMGLLFYGGVMELRWIAGIAAYVAAEKLISPRTGIARFTGMILIVWGGFELYLALA